MTGRDALLFAESEFSGTGNVRTTPSYPILQRRDRFADAI